MDLKFDVSSNRPVEIKLKIDLSPLCNRALVLNLCQDYELQERVVHSA